MSGTPALFNTPFAFEKQALQTGHEMVIASFTAAPRQKYTVRAYVELRVDGHSLGELIIEKYDEIEIIVNPSPLIVKLKGGNQMNPFSMPFDLYGDAHDPGVNGEVASREGIDCIFKCFNLNTGAACQ